MNPVYVENYVIQFGKKRNGIETGWNCEVSRRCIQFITFLNRKYLIIQASRKDLVEGKVKCVAERKDV